MCNTELWLVSWWSWDRILSCDWSICMEISGVWVSPGQQLSISMMTLNYVYTSSHHHVTDTLWYSGISRCRGQHSVYFKTEQLKNRFWRQTKSFLCQYHVDIMFYSVCQMFTCLKCNFEFVLFSYFLMQFCLLMWLLKFLKQFWKPFKSQRMISQYYRV